MAFGVFAALAAECLSIAGILVPLNSGINGNGKNVYLCVLRVLSEAPIISGASGRENIIGLPAALTDGPPEQG